MMRRLTRTALVGSVLLSAAALVGPGAALPAFAADAVSASSAASAPADSTSYTMYLSTTAATIRPGDRVTTVISFEASRRLHGAPVDLSVSGLPAGATASFAPPRARIGGRATLTISAGSASGAGTSTVTVGAIINAFGIDPIGTTTTFQLTIATP